jgi:hypothetical protein
MGGMQGESRTSRQSNVGVSLVIWMAALAIAAARAGRLRAMWTLGALVCGVAGAAMYAPAAAATGLQPGTIAGAAKSAPAAAAATAATAANGLQPFYTAIGQVTLSTDGIGTNDVSGIVQADKPAGATVKKAFMFAASTGLSNFTPPDGEVTIDGAPVSWNPADTLASSISSVNVAADVTALVGPKIDAAPAGRVDFTVAETDTSSMDGEILAVVFDNPSVANTTVTLLYGALATSGDHFALGLGAPLLPSSRVTMGLGISYGFQPSGQYSQIDVNGQRLTTSAGGQDDGGNDNGSLITVGGLDDNPANPTDPFATDQSPACVDIAPRCDDELYDLKPFVGSTDTSIGVDTVNPSNDDNIFFASFVLSATSAIVGEGVALTPADSSSQVGNFHFLTAQVQDSAGAPIVGRAVDMDITSGPNAGTILHGTTNGSGRASFNYASSATGTDVMHASFVDDSGATETSNDATMTWTPDVAGTFGGEWPYNGQQLVLNYTYGGAHRYLGNVVQGAQNWNNAGTKVHLQAWPGVPEAINIPIVDVNLSDTWWGMTLFADDCLNCGYTRNSIELNQRTLDPEPDEQRTKTATHELGHALGLEHPSEYGVSTSVPSVMWQGLLNDHVKSTPQQLDIDHINAEYP